MVVFILLWVSNFDKCLLVGRGGRKAATLGRPWLVGSLGFSRFFVYFFINWKK